MIAFEIIETKNDPIYPDGIINEIRLSSGEVFTTWQEFKDYASVTSEIIYGEGLHALAIGLKGEGEKPRLPSLQRSGFLLKMKYKKLTLVDISQWGKEIKADERSVKILESMDQIDGQISGSPARDVSNGYAKAMGYREVEARRRNRPNVLEGYLCSSKLPNRTFRPGYVGGMLHSPAARDKVHTIRAFDITSSYPWSALAAKVPMTKGIELSEAQLSELEVVDGKLDLGENTGFIGLFTIRNFRRKDWVKLPTLKGDDADRIWDLEVDEYGILSGTIQLVLNPYELELFRLQFTYEAIEIIALSIHGIGHIPEKAQDYLKDNYDLKASLSKEDPKREVAKATINYLIGFWGMDPFNSMIRKSIENGEVKELYIGNLGENFDKYAGEESHGHSAGKPRCWDFRWAAYILSHARLRIAKSELQCVEAGLEVLYTDTDSLKVSGDDEMIDLVFEALNRSARQECEYKGMGMWQDETDGYTRAVFVGPKVYIVENEAGERKATGAGASKESIQDSVAHLSLEEIAAMGGVPITVIERSLARVRDHSFGFKHVYPFRPSIIKYGE